MKLTEDQITAAARALSNDNADVCNVNREDNWNIYGDSFRETAKIALEAALATQPQVVSPVCPHPCRYAYSVDYTKVAADSPATPAPAPIVVTAGAQNEREAFEAWYEGEKLQYWLMCADKEMCFGIWQARAVLTAEKVAQAEPVAWAAGSLYDAIEEVLLSHKLSNWQDQYDGALGLVDRLCDADAHDISSGQHAIRLICDEIYNEVLTVAAPPAHTQVALTDEQILALNAGEVFFSESPSKYPEAGHGTQYHCGAPGLLKFARALLTATQRQSGGDHD